MLGYGTAEHCSVRSCNGNAKSCIAMYWHCVVEQGKGYVVYNVVKVVYRDVLYGSGIVVHGTVKVKCDVA